MIGEEAWPGFNTWSILKKMWQTVFFHLKSVGLAFASLSTIEQDGGGGGGVRVCEHHRVKVDPDFANVARGLADCIRAGVCVSADGEDLTELSNL